jgi:S1-C subfamily serine protease
MSLMASFSVMQDGQQQKIQSKTQFSDVKMRLADGTEIPARLIMKDPDLDLAFIAPEKDGEAALPTFTYVDLKNGARANELDVVVALGRLGKSLNRESTVNLGRLSAVVRKPRTFYVGTIAQALGVPVFTLEKEILGIALMRKGPGGGGMSLGNIMGGGMAPVVLPAEDVLEVAEQAKRKAQE